MPRAMKFRRPRINSLRQKEYKERQEVIANVVAAAARDPAESARR